MFAQQDFTELLIRSQQGDKAALDQFTPLLYEELRKLARRFLSAERSQHTLQPTALVHEAYLRLIDQRQVDWRNRAHFLGTAASMMRRILINYAEARNAAKRQGRVIVIPMDDALGALAHPEIDLIDLDRSLAQLSELDRQQARVVELRYFGGLSIEETAEVLKLSTATVKREWSTARLWLLQRMQGSTLQ